MTYTKEQIDRANQTDLVSFLQAQGEQLERAGQEYRWKKTDGIGPARAKAAVRLILAWSFTAKVFSKPLKC